MNPVIKAIAEQAVVDISRKTGASPILASLELLQHTLQIIPTSSESLLDYCREVLKEKDRGAA